jgi:NTP pyrophosphatase (non-canonical NTP hydrolase)
MPSDRDATPAPPPGHDHAEVAAGSLDRALALVRFLRANCAWDAAQTGRTLVPHLLEEAHEVVDAIHDGDDHALEGELGDLLLNLAFQVVVAEERGALTANSVTRRLEEKMRRRHPHLYGLGQRLAWEALKARERSGDEGVLDGTRPGARPAHPGAPHAGARGRGGIRLGGLPGSPRQSP